MESGFTESKLAVTSIQATLLFSSRHHPPSPHPSSRTVTGRLFRHGGNWQRCEEKWCRSLRPGGGEVFKMTFPQLMPDTFSRGKKKMQMSAAGWAGRGGLRGLQAGAWALIKVTRQQQLEHLTHTHVFIIPHSHDIQFTGTRCSWIILNIQCDKFITAVKWSSLFSLRVYTFT